MRKSKNRCQFAAENGLGGVQVTAIGAFSEVTLGFFDRQRKNYQEIPVKEQVEVLSLNGRVWPTLEMIVTDAPVHLRRVKDEETGLPLIDFGS